MPFAGLYGVRIGVFHAGKGSIIDGGVSHMIIQGPHCRADKIITELDEDGSGTMDFDEFCEMMMSQQEN